MVFLIMEIEIEVQIVLSVMVLVLVLDRFFTILSTFISLITMPPVLASLTSILVPIFGMTVGSLVPSRLSVLLLVIKVSLLLALLVWLFLATPLFLLLLLTMWSRWLNFVDRGGLLLRNDALGHKI